MLKHYSELLDRASDKKQQKVLMLCMKNIVSFISNEELKLFAYEMFDCRSNWKPTPKTKDFIRECLSCHPEVMHSISRFTKKKQ